MSQPHDTYLAWQWREARFRGKEVAIPKPSACFLSPELIKTLLNDPSSVKTDEVRREFQVLGRELRVSRRDRARSVQPTLLSVCQSGVLGNLSPQGGVGSDPQCL